MQTLEKINLKNLKTGSDRGLISNELHYIGIDGLEMADDFISRSKCSLTFDDVIEFLPKDQDDETKLHFHAHIYYRAIYGADGMETSEMEVVDITAFDIDRNEVYLPAPQYKIAETLIKNAL